MRKSMKTVVYLRVSTDRQGRSGLGIEAQREAVDGFLRQRGGWPPVEIYTEFESGRKANRPELAKALAACRVHNATLCIAKLDRLARNQTFLMGLVDSGVDVIFCDLPDIPAGATGRFMLQQMAAVAELEAGLISERTKAALRAKVERDGHWDRKAKHHLVAGAGQAAGAAGAKAKAEARAKDLRPYIAGIEADGVTSLRGIAAELNRRGVATPRGKEWTAAAVQRVLARAG